MMNKFIVNYKDACIYQSDLNILRSRDGWINDSIINYHMKRFYHSNPTTSTKIPWNFVDPTVVSYFVHQLSMDDSEDVDELRSLGCTWIDASKEYTTYYIFVPINSNFSKSNHDAFTSGHGLHWSLLLMIFHEGLIYFYHFDSSNGLNSAAAEIVATRMTFILSLVWNDNKEEMFNEEVRITECKCIQQCNVYDCGIHTLIHAEAIMEGIKTFKCNTLEECVPNDPTFYSHIIQRHLEDHIQAKASENHSIISMTREMRERIYQDILSVANDEQM
jgi:Ulp1 family protease